MIIYRYPRHRRHRLALRARYHHRHFVRRHLHNVLRTQQRRIGDGEEPKIVRNLGNIEHAAPEKRDFTAIL